MLRFLGLDSTSKKEDQTIKKTKVSKPQHIRIQGLNEASEQANKAADLNTAQKELASQIQKSLSELQRTANNPDAMTLILILKRLLHFSPSLRNMEYMIHLIQPEMHKNEGKCSLKILGKTDFPDSNLLELLKKSEYKNERADFEKLSEAKNDSGIIQYLRVQTKKLRNELFDVKAFTNLQLQSFSEMLRVNKEYAVNLAIVSGKTKCFITKLSDRELEDLMTFVTNKTVELKADLDALKKNRNLVPAGVFPPEYEKTFEHLKMLYETFYSNCQILALNRMHQNPVHADHATEIDHLLNMSSHDSTDENTSRLSESDHNVSSESKASEQINNIQAPVNASSDVKLEALIRHVEKALEDYDTHVKSRYKLGLFKRQSDGRVDSVDKIKQIIFALRTGTPNLHVKALMVEHPEFSSAELLKNLVETEITFIKKDHLQTSYLPAAVKKRVSAPTLSSYLTNELSAAKSEANNTLSNGGN